VATHAQSLKSESLQPSDRYGWSAVLRNLLLLLGLLTLAPMLADLAPIAPWLLIPFIGLFVYRLTVVMHDCTHHTLFGSRRLNESAGSLLGAITGIDFRSFSEQHWRHHRSYGEPGDPQGFHYLDLKHLTRATFLWHVFKPLLGFNLRPTFAESVLAPRNVARLVVNGGIILVALAQLTMLALVTGLGRHPILALLPFVSTATFGLFFSQLRGMAEHGVTDAGASLRNARSHAPHLLDRMLLYDVNFNYHGEHHEQPHIPSCHLPALHEQANVGCVATSMLGTIRTLYTSVPWRG
jgi:fatty acid desaturase